MLVHDRLGFNRDDGLRGRWTVAQSTVGPEMVQTQRVPLAGHLGFVRLVVLALCVGCCVLLAL